MERGEDRAGLGERVPTPQTSPRLGFRRTHRPGFWCRWGVGPAVPPPLTPALARAESRGSSPTRLRRGSGTGRGPEGSAPYPPSSPPPPDSGNLPPALTLHLPRPGLGMPTLSGVQRCQRACRPWGLPGCRARSGRGEKGGNSKLYKCMASGWHRARASLGAQALEWPCRCWGAEGRRPPRQRC